jgi:hypothetical protein
VLTRRLAALSAAVTLAACTQAPKVAAPPPRVLPRTDVERTVYAVGLTVASSFTPFKFSSLEVERAITGLRDGAAGQARVKWEDRQAAIKQLAVLRKDQPAPTVGPAPDEDLTIYAVGVAVWNNVEVFKFTPTELELVITGLRDGVAGKPEVNLEERQEAIQALVMARMGADPAGQPPTAAAPAPATPAPASETAPR